MTVTGRLLFSSLAQRIQRNRLFKNCHSNNLVKRKMDDILFERWKQLCNRDRSVSEIFKWWHVIQDRYSEADRHYHTLKHLHDMFSHCDQYLNYIQDSTAVAYSIIFHDIIYDAKAKNNEEKSAKLFMQFATEFQLKDDLTEKVMKWILLTKCHKTEAHLISGMYGTEDVHFFLDFDMAILGCDKTAYIEYASQIRQEYIHIPTQEYNTARAKVLRSFLEQTNIYATQEFRNKFEEVARNNIKDEIKRLESATC